MKELISRVSPRAGTFVKVVLAAAALGYVVYVVDPARIAAAAAGARLGWMAAAVALLPLNVAVQAGTWYLLLRCIMPDVRFRTAFASLLSGYTLGLVTPANAGDLVGRAFYLHHADKWELSAAVVTHRMLDMVIVVDVGLLALFYFIRTEPLGAGAFWKGLAVAGLGLALLLTLLAVLPRLTHRLAHRLLRRPGRQRRVAFLRRLSTGSMIRLLGLCLLVYAVFTSQFFLFLRAFEPAAPALTGYTGIALTYFVKYMIPPVTFLDVGIREGAAVFFLGTFGFEKAAAFNASFLLFCTNLIVPALAGLPFVARLRAGERSAPAPATSPQTDAPTP